VLTGTFPPPQNDRLPGFHTYDYARHFISSCTRILGLEGTPEGVEDNGSITRVAAFPIGGLPQCAAHGVASLRPPCHHRVRDHASKRPRHLCQLTFLSVPDCI
jgi:trehalose-6-phosphate synthase